MRRLVTLFIVIPLLGAGVAPVAAQTSSTAEELLAGMITEEIEPGAYKVTNDGVRDLMQAFSVYIGDDGSVWGVQRDSIFRLGGEVVERPKKPFRGIRVAPDGTVWSGHSSYDGQRWIEHEAPPGAAGYSGLQYSHLDGVTWVTWPDPQDSDQWIVARLDGEERIALDAPFVPFVPPGQEVAWVDLRATDDGDIWAETAFEYSRWTDGEWQRVFVSGGPSDQIAFDLLVDLTPDGSIWVHRMETPYEEEGTWIREVLRFFDGSEWLEWGDEDWPVFGSGELQVVGVGPDGSLWSTSGRGVLRFDRERWSHYLPDLQVSGHGAVGRDGSVWVLATAEPAEVSDTWFEDDDPWYDLYVITPEAVAAAEAVPTERPPAEEPTVVAETATTTQELLASMRVDEASPGLFRVDHDGVRSLSSTEADRVVAGHDGGIRLLDDDGFFRLGSEEAHEWPTPMPYGFAPNTNQVLEVEPDGTMWIIPVWSQPRPDMRHGSALRSTDGEEWTVQPCPGESDCQGVSVTPDGTVWASWREGPADGDGRVYLGQFGPTGWQPLDGDPPYEFSRMAFTDAGDLYGISSGWHSPLHRYADGVWQEERFADALVDVGPDGTVWQDAGSCIVRPPGPCGQDGLVRHTGGERMGWTSAELPGIALGFGHDREFQVAPDGSVWFSRWRSADGTDSGGDELRRESVFMGSESDLDESEPLACDGLARFDGETLLSWLPAACVSMDITADGSVWVLADEGKGKDLYVITPEAVAAAE